jgi:ribonuclease T1
VKNILKNTFFVFLLIGQFIIGCRQTQKTESYKAPEPTQTSTESSSDFKEKPSFKKHKKGKSNKEVFDNNKNQSSAHQSTDNQVVKSSKVPQKVYDVLKYVRENGSAMDSYVGGRKFGNFENLLPKKDENGRKINYQEWDVNPKQQGRNRGTERLITGSDGKAYFTNNHYKSFVNVE